MSDPLIRSRAAAAADREGVLGHVSSAVVHSLINRLAAVVSQAEMLKFRALPPDEVARRSDAIIGSVLEASTLARRLADYGRNAAVADLIPVDLDALIGDHLDDRPRGGVAVVADLKSRANFRGDPPRLRIMLDCLIDNAVEAIEDDPDGAGGVVTVSTRIDSRGWLQIDVRDDGPGMEPDVLELALEPFFGTKPDRGGLGLPLARSIWRRHRGAFSLEAPYGCGTLVRLSRPPAG